MSHTYTSILIHSIFSTKNRQPFLTTQVQDRLYPYFCGIAKGNRFNIVAVDGIEDHVHLILSVPADLQISKAMQLLKGSSSHWIHETFPDLSDFAWQEGYAAFSVSKSGVERATAYILGQKEHHKRISFREEYLSFLKAQNIAYDPRYVFG